MVDPMSVALTVLKSTSTAAKVKGFIERLANRNTEAFIAARDEMHREWTVETANRLTEHVRASREALMLIAEAIEEEATRARAREQAIDEHERQIAAFLDQPETQVLALLFGEAAYREALSERRTMLSHAAAGLVSLEVDVEDKCRVEKDLRNLDPGDVLELDRLARLAGPVQRTRPGSGVVHFDEDRHRYVVLSELRAADALLSSGCIRVLNDKFGGSTAVVTDRGRVILGSPSG